MPHLKQIIRHLVHSVKIICHHAVTVMSLIIKIQKKHRNLCVTDQHIQIILFQKTNDDHSLHFVLLKKPWELPVLLFCLRTEYLQHGKALFTDCFGRYCAVHFPVKGFILVKISVRNNDSDIVAFAFLHSSCF